MKKSLLFLTLFVSVFMSIQAQDIELITFADTYNSIAGSTFNVPMIEKNGRANRNSSKIIILNENSLSDEVLKAVKYASSVWENSIDNFQSIFIEVNEGIIEEDIRTDVYYAQIGSLMYPLALKYYLEQISDRPVSYPDGIITINSNTEWDYNVGENISSELPNLTFGMLRAIGRVLGFGSSVKVIDEGKYKFSDRRRHSIFDSHVFDNSDVCLTEIPVNAGKENATLKNYIEKPNSTFWVVTSNSKHKLQSPLFSSNMPPFACLDNNKSLMRANMNDGDYILQIDADTSEILHEIGWNTHASANISIICDELGETGLASAYLPHTFKIDTHNQPISVPSWTLEFPLKDGSFELVSLQDKNLSCTVPVVDEIAKYKVNFDGDIECSLQFSCMINGVKTEARPYKLTLELAPVIEYARITEIVDNYPYSSYDAHYQVKYLGSPSIHVSVEEEYSSILKSKYIKEPYLFDGVADHITSPYSAWIDFYVENEYGESTYTIELAPYGEVCQSTVGANRILSGQSGIRQKNPEADDKFIVIDSLGRKIMECSNEDEILKFDIKGLLLVKCYAGGTLNRTYKIIK